MEQQPQPAYIGAFNEIIEELNILAEDLEIDEFSLIRKLNQLEARALDMQGPDSAAYSFSALGSIASARKNPEKTRHYHSMSLKLSKDSVLKLNYAASLSFLSFYQEALDIALPVFEANPLDLNAVDILILITFKMGDERRFLDFARRWARIKNAELSEHPLYRAYLEELEESAQLTEVCVALSSPSIHKLYEDDSEGIH